MRYWWVNQNQIYQHEVRGGYIWSPKRNANGARNPFYEGFEDNGRLIVSPVAHRPSLHRMGIDTEKTINVGSFTSGQKQFLDFHRNAVLCRPTAAEKDWKGSR